MCVLVGEIGKRDFCFVECVCVCLSARLHVHTVPPPSPSLQVFDLKRAPALETPPYLVLKKRALYEVRRYPPFLVAETPLDNGASSGGGGGSSGGSVAAGPRVSPASGSSAAFMQLANYIFGQNEGGAKMEMTTPVSG